MKFLFKVIVLPILMLLFFPILFLALTYKSVEIPFSEYESVQTVTLTEMIQTEMDVFLADNNEDSEVSIGFSQANANIMVLNMLRERNASFALDKDSTDEDNLYVYKHQFFGYQGSWVRFKEDVVEIESGLHVYNWGFTYKTRLLIAFKLDVDTDEVVLKLDKVTIGNLPLAWTFGPASWLVEKISGYSISDLINDRLEGIATFDVGNREVRLSIDELVKKQSEQNPQSGALIEMLLKVIEENDLLDIGFKDESFEASLALGKLRDDQAPFVLTPLQRIVNDAQLQSILASRASSLVLSTLTASADQTPFIELDALTLNRIFEYFLRDQQVETGVLQKTDLFEKYEMIAYVPYITMDEHFIVNIPITISDKADFTSVFPTTLRIKATPSVSESDLLITIDEINIGQMNLDKKYIETIFDFIGDSALITDGAFVIKDFDQQMNQAGMSITGAQMVQSKLRLSVTLTDLPITEIQDAIQGALDLIKDNPSFPPELNDAINDVLDNLDSEEDVMQAVETLLETLNTLNDEDQQLLLNELLDALETLEYDLEDIFNFLP